LIVVGGVGHLYQGDFDLGRRAVELLHEEDLGLDVVVEDFSYGAVAVAQRLEDLRPAALVLVGAVERGRAPGAVTLMSFTALDELTPDRLQLAVTDAVTGYISIDLVVEVAHGLGALPPRTVAVEVEPARVEPSVELSPEAESALPSALRLVRAEITRARAGA
jgi:hydrogenase maturation protease